MKVVEPPACTYAVPFSGKDETPPPTLPNPANGALGSIGVKYIPASKYS
jgi:hypothetical protein